MRQFYCPYCSEELPPPTRKRLCPHCGKAIVVRTRPNQDPAWVRVEDIPAISKEWADEMLRRDIKRRRETGIEGLELARHNIRQWVSNCSPPGLGGLNARRALRRRRGRCGWQRRRSCRAAFRFR